MLSFICFFTIPLIRKLILISIIKCLCQDTRSYPNREVQYKIEIIIIDIQKKNYEFVITHTFWHISQF